MEMVRLESGKEDGKTQYSKNPILVLWVHSVLLPESFTALGKQFAPSVLLAESLQRLVRAAVLLPERVTSSAPFLFLGKKRRSLLLPSTEIHMLRQTPIYRGQI
jgi:hypothetical protein